MKFKDERDWEQFHSAKDLALAINLEAGELLEQFLWKKAEGADKHKVEEELADIISFTMLLANKYNLDVKNFVMDKIVNPIKYPVDQAKGSAKKYDQL